MNANHQPSAADLRQGVIFIVSAMLILPGIDAIAKGLSGSISAGEVAWVRHVLQAIFLLPFAIRDGGLRIGPNLWSHIARGALMATVTVVFFALLVSQNAVVHLEPAHTHHAGLLQEVQVVRQVRLEQAELASVRLQRLDEHG